MLSEDTVGLPIDLPFALALSMPLFTRWLMMFLSISLNALKVCDDDSTRKDILSEIRQTKDEIQEIEKDLAIAEAKCFIVTEEQIVTRLMKLADGDITNQVYRRSLIRVFANKILIYDDRITITFKTGDDEVTITRELLDKIEEGLGNETLCFSNGSVHQK